MMRANVERMYDLYDRMAMEAMMIRSAHHAKKIKQSDLFSRPVDKDEQAKKMDKSKDKIKDMNEWMAGIAEFQGADIGVNEE